MSTDSWENLKQFTHARIALGRAGHALPTPEILQFRMAHALAKDAVYSDMHLPDLTQTFRAMGHSVVAVQSQAHDRSDYLRHPNKGRVLVSESISELKNAYLAPTDLCIVIADGLSADAANLHAELVVKLVLGLLPNWSVSPLVLAQQSRVALSDPIGELLGSSIVLMLIGERPGLSSPNSLGAYITYGPKTGNTDERRNCVSNIHPEGLSYAMAASKIAHLLEQMRSLKISGVHLKDNHDAMFGKGGAPIALD